MKFQRNYLPKYANLINLDTFLILLLQMQIYRANFSIIWIDEKTSLMYNNNNTGVFDALT